MSVYVLGLVVCSIHRLGIAPHKVINVLTELYLKFEGLLFDYFLPLLRMFFGRPRREFRSSEFLLAGTLCGESYVSYIVLV